MNAKGVPLEIIRGYLGHSDIRTTQGYIVNNREKQQTNNLIIHALSDMNNTYVLTGTH